MIAGMMKSVLFRSPVKCYATPALSSEARLLHSVVIQFTLASSQPTYTVRVKPWSRKSYLFRETLVTMSSNRDSHNQLSSTCAAGSWTTTMLAKCYPGRVTRGL